MAHQDSRYDEWAFSVSMHIDPGTAGRGLSLDLTNRPRRSGWRPGRRAELERRPLYGTTPNKTGS
ncbi:MAG: hypothetical protein OXF93_07190 [Acidobacteria bacterium]|nr:hypothetical protein [Acidobacteriota bacterium]